MRFFPTYHHIIDHFYPFPSQKQIHMVLPYFFPQNAPEVFHELAIPLQTLFSPENLILNPFCRNMCMVAMYVFVFSVQRSVLIFFGHASLFIPESMEELDITWDCLCY